MVLDPVVVAVNGSSRNLPRGNVILAASKRGLSNSLPDLRMITARASDNSSLHLCSMASKIIHQGWRQAVIGLQADLLQSRPDGGHVGRIGSCFDD